MARREKIIYELVDDEDGRPGAVPVVMGIGNEVFEGDLHPTRLAAMQEIFDLLRTCGRPYGTSDDPPPPDPHPPAAPQPPTEASSNHHAPAPDAATVRSWARKKKLPVKKTGRIDGRVTEAYIRYEREGNPRYLSELLQHPDFQQQEPVEPGCT